MQQKTAIIIMGVAGAGKTTVGKLLSQQTSIPFFDADNFHNKENKAKMQAGIALTDEDRSEWLLQLNSLLLQQLQNNSCILACSALKETYRNTLSKDCGHNIIFIHLTGSYEKILERIRSREHHFVTESLLHSQFHTLENPVNAFTLSIEKTPEEMVAEIQKEIFHRAEIGIIGLGVMGKSLCRNIAAKGFRIAMYNRHVPGKEENIAIDFKAAYPELNESLAFDDLKNFVASLQHPKKIMMMVNAGSPTDEVINSLVPLLNANDCIIDGGNTYFEDTLTRQLLLNKYQINFIGCGISGGEEGALKGPSLMPGGNKQAYQLVKPFLETIAAKDINGKPCCAYIGDAGSGHFVKMVHNGIEYAEMQLLAEVYALLTPAMNPDEIAATLQSWKQKDTGSYLLDITIDILKEKEENGQWLLHQIIDNAQSKGTGSWATIEITRQNIPATLIATALFARHISAYKELRNHLNTLYPKPAEQPAPTDTEEIRKAYELARIINHFQGFWFMSEAFKKFNWEQNLSEIARIWTNGCIIRSALMQELVMVLSGTENILTSPYFIEKIITLKPSLALVTAGGIQQQIAIPCFSEAINFLNAITTTHSSANLLQAQRDYFGAHLFQRYDVPSGTYFHHEWKHY